MKARIAGCCEAPRRTAAKICRAGAPRRRWVVTDLRSDAGELGDQGDGEEVVPLDLGRVRECVPEPHC